MVAPFRVSFHAIIVDVEDISYSNQGGEERLFTIVETLAAMSVAVLHPTMLGRLRSWTAWKQCFSFAQNRLDIYLIPSIYKQRASSTF